MSVDRKQKEQEELLKYGKLVTDAVCAGKSVRLYEKGYVRVGGALFRSGAAFERLLGVSGSADVAKKSGLGRAAGFALTGGLNVLLTPSKRGDLYLTIVTEAKTHTLHMSPPTKSDLQAMHEIVATGESILQRLKMDISAASVVHGSESSSHTEDLLSQLQRLAELRSSGVLTDDEFTKLKSRLIEDEPQIRVTSVSSELVSVVLVGSPSTTGEKIELVKEIKAMQTAFSLKDAKNAVDNLPSVLFTEVTLREAQSLVSLLEAKGAKIELRSV